MRPEDSTAFATILHDTYALYGKESIMTDGVSDTLWDMFQLATREQFKAAMLAHSASDTNFHPLPGKVRQMFSDYPSAEEAWNTLPKDEATTGWMFPEMEQAMGACWDSLQRGDLIAARMAFVEKYKAVTRGKLGQPKWRISEATEGGFEARNQAKIDLLEQHPERAPRTLANTRAALEDFREAPKGLAGAVIAIEQKTIENEKRPDVREVGRRELRKMRDILGLKQTPFTLGEEN